MSSLSSQTTQELKQATISSWFKELRDLVCCAFERIEQSYAQQDPALIPGKFSFKPWERPGGGGGVIGLMRGNVFEKVGVNISTVFGAFPSELQKEISENEEETSFWASGISLVAHMCSPLVPAVHMNLRYIITDKPWFAGGADLTPYFPNQEDTQDFHQAFKEVCDAHDPEYYPRYKKWCDAYFYLPHRQEPRGMGGIFYDGLNSGDWHKDFAFTQDVGQAFLSIYPQIVHRNMHKVWTSEQREYQLYRRGRYVEFNLLYDRGTQFGLKTDGNIEAILMSLPPVVAWP